MYPNEYVQYLVHFHTDRDYFECHEILEEYWKQVDPGNKNSIWVGFIQLAVSSYHHRRENFKGAQKTIEKAIRIFQLNDELIKTLGLNPHLLNHILTERLVSIKQYNKYESLHLPVINQILLDQCKLMCKKIGVNWGECSDKTNSYLIHRHKLRDRQSIIDERLNAIKIRKGNE